MINLLEKERIEKAKTTDPNWKSKIGQFFTPYSIANFMASFLHFNSSKEIKLLDPGAGMGILTCAFLEKIKDNLNQQNKIEVTAYEFDHTILSKLKENIKNFSKGLNIKYKIIEKDFIQDAVFNIQKQNTEEKFNYIILNPPYKKIARNSLHRLLLRKVGIETVNLYSAFTALSILLLKHHGILVAIIPRSFCNGTYYKPFRELILRYCNIKHIHLFESRTSAFKDESVLQENIIIILEKEKKQAKVTVSYSQNENFDNVVYRIYSFSEIILPGDSESFINIPIPGSTAHKSLSFNSKLSDLKISVSTGPIVDFRCKEYLSDNYKKGCIPLLYPIHFKNYRVNWPIENSKKPNALLNDIAIRKYFFPQGYYVAVRRFSSKEEKKRIVASIITPDDFSSLYFSAENHLNIFHINKNSIDKKIAFGLMIYLNSTYIDEYFRKFSGHTQVNATDLRQLPYPDLKQLIQIGQWALKQKVIKQDDIDNITLSFQDSNA